MLDIETLRIIWWLLLGFLIIAFAITDGFDFGIAVLFPFVAKNESERRLILNVIGAIWEGNQVWIIAGAGAMFAVWPLVYAVAFSGLYFIILLLLLTMGITRPVSFKYRSKIKNKIWRATWDHLVFIGGLAPALLFGVLLGNVMQGIPFEFDQLLQVTYGGSFISLLNPFACLCGFISLVMLTMHGGVYLALRSNDPLCSRVLPLIPWLACSLIVLFLIAGIWVAFYLPGYHLISPALTRGFSNPLNKEVGKGVGLWLENYSRFPLILLAPILGVTGAIGVLFSTLYRKLRTAFLFSCTSVFGIVATVGLSMFPFIIPSSTHLASSLLIWDSSSTQQTLNITLIASVILIPLIIVYSSWVYYVLSEKVTIEDLEG